MFRQKIKKINYKYDSFHKKNTKHQGVEYERDEILHKIFETRNSMLLDNYTPSQ